MAGEDFWIVGACRIVQIRVEQAGSCVTLFSEREACDAMEGELDLEPEDLASYSAFPPSSLGDLGGSCIPSVGLSFLIPKMRAALNLGLMMS